MTAQDGTAAVRLPPGNYTVESDRPIALRGKAYQWTQIVDIATGRDAVLELTAANADSAAITSETPSDAAPIEVDASAEILMHWRDSVVTVWTPAARASGFVVDSRGLIATNQRVIGSATSVEVQLTPTVKAAAKVLVADRSKDVAILLMNASVLLSVRPISLGCALPSKPPLVDGQKIFTIGSPLGEDKDTITGSASRVDAHAAVSDSGSRSTALAAPSLRPTAPWSGSRRSWTRKSGTGATTPE